MYITRGLLSTKSLQVWVKTCETRSQYSMGMLGSLTENLCIGTSWLWALNAGM